MAGGEPYLQSISQDVVWAGPVLHAHETPHAGNPAGIYALAQRPAPRGDSRTEYFIQGVYGTVALTGTVVEHEDGYRAERATIRDLWLGHPGRWPRDLYARFCRCEVRRMLAERYQCEVHLDQASLEESAGDMDLDATSGRVVNLRLPGGFQVQAMLARYDVRQERASNRYFYAGGAPVLAMPGYITISLEFVTT
jgi:hypothetical protein